MGLRVEMVPCSEPPLQEALSSFHRNTQAIVVAGGDGSLNWVVNTLLSLEVSHPPLAVLPWGTANDFSSNILKSPFSIDKLLGAIGEGRTRRIDVGCINDRFFINVAGAGLLVDVAHNTSSSLKQSIGMLAYYLEGALHLPNYKPFSLSMKHGRKWDEMEADLFLVLNGKTAGGLRNLAPDAELDDGKLDILIVKNSGIPGLASLLPRLLSGQHTTDSRILYFQEKTISFHAPPWVETDLDGEPGPPFPLHFSILPGRLEFFTF